MAESSTLTAVSIAVCECDEILADEDVESDTIYECGSCGDTFSLSENGSHRCSGCGKFASKLTADGCSTCCTEYDRHEGVYCEKHEAYAETECSECESEGDEPEEEKQPVAKPNSRPASEPGLTPEQVELVQTNLKRLGTMGWGLHRANPCPDPRDP